MDFLSYLLSDNFCFSVILQMSCNKTKYFSLQSCHLTVLGKGELTVLHHSMRKRTQRVILQSPTFSKETIYLSSYNDKLTFISCFSLSFCPSLSLSHFPLPFCKAFHIQSNYFAVCLFHASVFLGECLKALGCIFPFGGSPRTYLCSPSRGDFCARHPP